jgi:hypothetical protein
MNIKFLTVGCLLLQATKLSFLLAYCIIYRNLYPQLHVALLMMRHDRRKLPIRDSRPVRCPLCPIIKEVKNMLFQELLSISLSNVNQVPEANLIVIVLCLFTDLVILVWQRKNWH